MVFEKLAPVALVYPVATPAEAAVPVVVEEPRLANPTFTELALAEVKVPKVPEIPVEVKVPPVKFRFDTLRVVISAYGEDTPVDTVSVPTTVDEPVEIKPPVRDESPVTV